MGEVLVALLPALGAAIWRYTAAVPAPLLAAVGAAWLADIAWDRQTATDGTAPLIGLIFFFLLPIDTPWWLAALGGALAVLLGKQLFGGVGHNLFNPAALARLFLTGLYPTHFLRPVWPTGADGVTTATPLAKEAGSPPHALGDLLWGPTGCTFAEAVPWAILAGGCLLLILRTADWRVPITYFAATLFFVLLLPAGDRLAGHASWLATSPLAHLLAGGTLFAGFFMLTDPVTSPFTPEGRIVFAFGAAFYLVLVRFYTPFPDGALLSVLGANAAVPLLDRWLVPGEG